MDTAEIRSQVDRITQQVKAANADKYEVDEIRKVATLMVLSLDDHMVVEETEFFILMNQVDRLTTREQRRWSQRVWDQRAHGHMVIKFDSECKMLFCPRQKLALVPINISAAVRAKGDVGAAQATLDVFRNTAPPKDEHDAYCKAAAKNHAQRPSLAAARSRKAPAHP